MNRMLKDFLFMVGTSCPGTFGATMIVRIFCASVTLVNLPVTTEVGHDRKLPTATWHLTSECCFY